MSRSRHRTHTARVPLQIELWYQGEVVSLQQRAIDLEFPPEALTDLDEIVKAGVPLEEAVFQATRTAVMEQVHTDLGPTLSAATTVRVTPAGAVQWT